MATQPRITLPFKIVQLYEKVKFKKSIKDLQSKKHLKGPVLISCNRRQFNHHVGQTYSELTPQLLASGAWKHKGSKGDYFTILPRGKNPSLCSSISNFEEFGLNLKIIDALKAMQINCPTNIQSLTIPSLMIQKSILCTAETGSGKTLAYLLPIFESILRAKDQDRPVNDDETKLNQPSAFIVLPSRELAQQVHDVCVQLGSGTNIVVDLKCGGSGTQGVLRRKTMKKVDILVATPGILSKLLSNNFYKLQYLRWVVFDEADTLLDDSFDQIISNIVNKIKVTTESMLGEKIQLCLVGATMPTSLQSKLNQIIPMEDLEIIKSEYLHKLLPHISQKFIRMSATQTPEHLINFLKSLKAGTVVIIFCNKSDTVCYLGHMLTANGLSSIHLHADMPQKVRSGKFESFTNRTSDILISTDVASRGLDTTHVDYVINFEFPNFISDYMHRVGRVGRVGSPQHCYAISYITKPWHVELLWQIEISARKNIVLHNVNANIKRKLNFINSENDDSKDNLTNQNVT